MEEYAGDSGCWVMENVTETAEDGTDVTTPTFINLNTEMELEGIPSASFPAHLTALAPPWPRRMCLGLRGSVLMPCTWAEPLVTNATHFTEWVPGEPGFWASIEGQEEPPGPGDPLPAFLLKRWAVRRRIATAPQQQQQNPTDTRITHHRPSLCMARSDIATFYRTGSEKRPENYGRVWSAPTAAFRSGSPAPQPYGHHCEGGMALRAPPGRGRERARAARTTAKAAPSRWLADQRAR